MSNADQINKATDFSLDELSLIGSSGKAVDIRAIMYELNVVEDLFGNTMSGSVMINDTNNMISSLPIVGAEFLIVNLTKPGTPWKMKKVFRVYKITDRNKLNASSEYYVLHFCSEEAIISESVKVSKVYKGMTISSMVKDITTNFLNIDTNKFPASSLQETQGSFDVVVPFWSPMYTINWLSRMARSSKSPGCSFFFFEDSTSFRFSSLEDLSQQTPLQVLNFNPMNFLGEKEDKSDTTIRHESGFSYELIRSPDMIQSLSTGAYSGKLTTIDPISQKISTSKVNSAVLFDNTNHLNPYNYMQLSPSRTKLPVTEQYDSYFRVASSNLKTDTWILQRNSYLSGMHEFQLKVQMPGNVYLRAGQVITVNFPAAIVPSREIKLIDDVYGGNYLITCIRHKVSRTSYVCSLELSKDSLKATLPTAIQSNPAMNKLRSL